ncbi:WD repeat domain phosphoinositide-interacting protein 4-like [Watersipora subatra]|uniref:WD repeat domain phosphoinositide-interacting protein 4-like n=1 Tax=Watersipora subatra TaxID=2589382 RepID=UPI00355C990E
MAVVHQVRLSRDFSIFTSCGDDGFRIFNVDPLSQMAHFTEDQLGDKILKAEILNRSNLVALVPKSCDYAVKLWNCEQERFEAEVTFDYEVTNIKFHFDRLIIATRTAIYLFSYTPQLVKKYSYDTRPNPWGVMTVNSGPTAQILAFPGVAKIGTVQVEDVRRATSISNISAHEHELACVTLNSDGSKIATASKHGTLVRLFSVRDGRQLLELRRGSNTALVYSLNFSADSSFLCAASDKGTVHIFAVLNSSLNRKSAFENVAGMLTSYNQSQWGVSSFTVPAEMACVCCFVANKRASVVVIGVDGSYHLYSFVPDASTCRSEVFEKYIELGDSMEM